MTDTSTDESEQRDLRWIKEEIQNMFVTDAYNRLLYDVFLDSEHFKSIDLNGNERLLFFVFGSFEKLFTWGQNETKMMHYDPVVVKRFDLNDAESGLGFSGQFLEVAKCAIKTPRALCICISVHFKEGFQTLYCAAYFGKETTDYKLRRLNHYGTKCHLTFDCDFGERPTSTDAPDPTGLDFDPLVCNACLKFGTNLKRCVRCKQAHYCDENCQRSNWKEHSKNCKEKR
jgi:hypothetical protein